MKDRLFEIWFSLQCKPGNREFQTVLARFGSAYEVYNAESSELERVDCSSKLKQALSEKSLAEATMINEYCKTHRVGILFWTDEDYPASLRSLLDPPSLLYYRGKLPALSEKLCISVVGTRSMSEYGKRMAYKIGYELAAAGTVVISGMALGNDSVATAGALAAGGATVAVLGSGIDVIYPREHTALAEAVGKNGCIMTEYPPSTPPKGQHFPQRNRIISGLSQGTVVVEGDTRSGAMITAKTAVLQGRELYAFPGNVGVTNSSGTNRLIRDGAAVVLCARDVLVNYHYIYHNTLDMKRLEAAESKSEPNEALLHKLGVCTKSVIPQDASTEAPASDAVQDPAKGSTAEGKRRPSRSSRSTPEKPADPRSPASPATPPVHGDGTERVIKTLSETQRKIFEALPLDHAVPLDYLTREGFSMSDIMASLTVLELKALVISLPGGLYARK